MTPALVRSDLAALLRSDEVDLAIKVVIVGRASEYATIAGPRGLDELARFASCHEHEIPPEVVLKMAQAGVAAQQVVLLLEPHLASISRNQLFTILLTLGMV